MIRAWQISIGKGEQEKVLAGLKKLRDESLGQFLFTELKVDNGSDVLLSVCGPEVYIKYCVNAIEAMCS